MRGGVTQRKEAGCVEHSMLMERSAESGRGDYGAV